VADPTREFTILANWKEVSASLNKGTASVILADRSTIATMRLAELVELASHGLWPPVLLVDVSGKGARDALALAQQVSQQLPHQYQIGDLRIDTRRKRAGLGNHWTTLPPIQYRLLLTLAQHKGEVMTCQDLLRAVWGYESEESEARELLKVHIRQIRRRLGLDQNHPYIRSIRGFDYMLAPPDED